MSKQFQMTSSEYLRLYGRRKLVVKTKGSLVGRPNLSEPPIRDSVGVKDEVIKITLVGLFPSLNKMLRMHWAIRKKQKEVTMKRLSVLKIPKFTTKVSISLVFHHSVFGDEDGLSGRAKGVLDCLVNMGVFIDDSPEYVTIEKPIQIKSRRKEQKLEINIKTINL